MNNNLKKSNKLRKKLIKIREKLIKKSNRIELKLKERIISVNRVSKVTKGGKKLSFRAVVVTGNNKGYVGLGIGKADQFKSAIEKARKNSKKNFIEIPKTKSLTIPHQVKGNFGACQVIMRPSIEGSGVVAGGATRIVLEIAGIKNVIAKQLGSDNLLNNAYATISALKQLKTKSLVLKQRNIYSNYKNGK